MPYTFGTVPTQEKPKRLVSKLQHSGKKKKKHILQFVKLVSLFYRRNPNSKNSSFWKIINELYNSAGKVMLSLFLDMTSASYAKFPNRTIRIIGLTPTP